MWWGQCMEQFRLSNEIDFLTDPRFPFQRIWQNNNCENDKATAKTSINFEIIFAQKTVPYQERDNSVGEEGWWFLDKKIPLNYARTRWEMCICRYYLHS